MKLTGTSLQVGGDATLEDTRGFEDDRRWFARHVGRSYRVRRAIGGERDLHHEPGVVPMVAVHQVRPGNRIRVGFGWQGQPPINSEAEAAEIFAIAAEGHPQFDELATALREGRL